MHNPRYANMTTDELEREAAILDNHIAMAISSRYQKKIMGYQQALHDADTFTRQGQATAEKVESKAQRLGEVLDKLCTAIDHDTVPRIVELREYARGLLEGEK